MLQEFMDNERQKNDAAKLCVTYFLGGLQKTDDVKVKKKKLRLYIVISVFLYPGKTYIKIIIVLLAL